MESHRLEPDRECVTQVFSRDHEPVLTINPGDTVVVRSLDASGYLEAQRAPGEARPQMFQHRRGHCLVGPIEVRGTAPGTTLAIRIVDLRPDNWGWTACANRDSVVNQRLGIVDSLPSWLLWRLDPESGTGVSDQGVRIRLRPFLGVIGLPPDEPGEHSTIPPRPLGGGNIDCRELIAGSTLYLPVTVPGAKLCVGDGHAAQGDGEVAGTAIECGMTTELVVDVITDPAVPTIHAVTPSGRVTFGFSADLNDATIMALDAMVGWMQALFGVKKAQALALASSTVDLRVTQVANEVWGVHAVLPDDRFC